MQWVVLRIFLTLGICMPFFSYAADDAGYIGKALGLDFYSTIDDGNYALVTSMIKLDIQKKPTLAEFWEGCPNIGLIWNSQTSTEILGYGKLSEALKNNGINSIPMNSLLSLQLCLQGKYDELVKSKQKEVGKIQEISSIGLYSDGDTSNSDYDIMTDIDKINSVLFTEKLKYNGVVNRTSESLKRNLFAGIVPIPLLTKEKSKAESGSIVLSGSVGLGSIIWEVCSKNTTGIPLGSLVDESFMSELSLIVRWPASSMRSAKNPPTPEASRSSQSAQVLPLANDFFSAKPSCSGLFCIDIRYIASGNQNVLGGSKSISLESIIDKHSNILEPIAATNLACQRMTNNAWQNPMDRLKLTWILTWGKIIYQTKPQQVKRFGSERTAQTEAEELNNIQRCAYASAWLSTNTSEANGPLIQGYSLNSATNMENIGKRTITTPPQNTDQYGIGKESVSLYMDEWRKAYYDSFMSDVTQIEGFTRSIVQVMTNIVNINGKFDNLPTGC